MFISNLPLIYASNNYKNVLKEKNILKPPKIINNISWVKSIGSGAKSTEWGIGKWVGQGLLFAFL